jgi:hypothetical protein
MTEDLFTRVQEFLKENSHYSYRYSDGYHTLRAKLNLELETLIAQHFKFEVYIILGDGNEESLLFDDNFTMVSYDTEKFKSKDVFLGHIMKDFLFGVTDPGA